MRTVVRGSQFNRKRRRAHRAEDEERVKPRAAQPQAGRLGLMALQQQVGNRAVQQMLAQRQGEEQEKTAKEPVEVGQIEIEKPKIEYYEVTGNSLAEVTRQLLPAGQWYQYEYRQTPKIENGVVTQVDITVTITLRLPRWVGPGWEHAADADKLDWLELLKTVHIDPEKSEEMTELARQWLLGPNWQQAPDRVKKEWQGMLLALQTREQSPLDLARRRAMVLQQRLIKQPENQVKAIFDRFLKDLKVEQEAYNRQMEFGREQKVSLGAGVMVQ